MRRGEGERQRVGVREREKESVRGRERRTERSEACEKGEERQRLRETQR